MRKKILKKKRLIVFSILILLFIILFSYKTQNNLKTVREPVVAGSWYPGDEEELSNAVDGYFLNVKKLDINGTIKAIIAPHAGYAYSGQIAATAFKQLDDIYKDVFLLGPSHRYPLEKASIADATHYKTPLGEIKISEKAKQMLKEEIINSIPEAHAKEHSLEIELPFLQKQLSNFELVPILIGRIDPEQFKEIILKYLEEDDLIVVSVDLSHYHEYEEAKELDYFAIEKIINLDDIGIFNAEIDAPWAVSTLLKIAKEKNWIPYLLYYANSGDITKDKTRVVGYASILFYEEEKKEEELTKKEKELSNEEKDFLLNLARKTLDGYYKTGKKININEEHLTENLLNVQGCFVTLVKNGRLRGCIGHILPQEELYKCVIDNAISAAIYDTRFNPVTKDELKDIEIDVSVLSVPEKLPFESGEELKSKLRPLIDGVVLKQGFYQSTYLPQVWEQLPGKEQFLSSLCNKAGMDSNCWKDTKTEVFTYQADVFEEE